MEFSTLKKKKPNWKCKMVPALKPVSRKLKIIILLGSCTQRVKYYFSLMRELTSWGCSAGGKTQMWLINYFSWGPRVLGHRLVLQYIIIIHKYSTRGVSSEQKNVTKIQKSFVQRYGSFFQMAWSECECRIKIKVFLLRGDKMLMQRLVIFRVCQLCGAAADCWRCKNKSLQS